MGETAWGGLHIVNGQWSSGTTDSTSAYSPMNYTAAGNVSITVADYGGTPYTPPAPIEPREDDRAWLDRRLDEVIALSGVAA